MFAPNEQSAGRRRAARGRSGERSRRGSTSNRHARAPGPAMVRALLFCRTARYASLCDPPQFTCSAGRRLQMADPSARADRSGGVVGVAKRLAGRRERLLLCNSGTDDAGGAGARQSRRHYQQRRLSRRRHSKRGTGNQRFRPLGESPRTSHALRHYQEQRLGEPRPRRVLHHDPAGQIYPCARRQRPNGANYRPQPHHLGAARRAGNGSGGGT